MSLEMKNIDFPQQTSKEQENPWTSYFGQPIREYRTTANARQTFDRYDLPEAYKGSNLFLADTLEGFILDESDLLWTRNILPLVKTDQLSITYSSWTFSETLAGRVPHEGISRIITSRKSKTSGAMERRGLAFILEHGFMKTEEGRRQYMLNIQQIVQAVQVTLNFDVLSALLTCKRYDIQWLKEHGYFRQHLPDIMQRELSMFGIIQKDVNGFDIAIEEYKKQLGRYSVAPDSLILPSKLQMYIPMVPQEKILYQNRGKLAVDQFESGPIASFRNIKIYEAKAFDLGNGELPVNLMASGEQIGHHNVMALDENLDPSQYRSEHRDIEIYDASADNFVRVSFMDAMKHTMRFGEGSDDLHEQFLEKNDHINDHTDALLYFDERRKGWKKATMFGQLHKDDAKHLDFLPRSLLKKIIASAKSDLSSSFLASIEEFVKLVGGEGSKLIAGKTWGKVWKKMKEMFPESLLVTMDVGTASSPAKWVEDMGLVGLGLETPDSWRKAITFLVVFGDRDKDITRITAAGPEFQGAPFTGAGADLAQTHEMSVAALEHSKALDAKLYKDAVSKYEVGSDMHKKLVTGVAQLIGQNVDNLEDPVFTNTYSMLSKFNGRASNDAKQMQRMGLESLIEKAKKAMPKTSPISVGEVVFKGSDSYIGSALHKVMSHASAHAAEDDEEEDTSKSLFSRRGKAAKIGTMAGEIENFDAAAKYAVSAKNMVDRIEMIENMSEAIDRLVGLLFVTSSISEKAIEAMHSHDVIIPFDILLARPFMEFEMNHGILTKAGRATGATYVGHSDFQLGDNVQSKLHYGNYTFYAKALVTNPKNVVLLKNIFINKYIGGFNTKFFSTDEAMADKHDDVFINPGRASMFAMLLPCGTFNRRAVMGEDPVDLRSALPFYADVLGMDAIEDPTYDDEFFEPNSQASLNAMCYQGPQFSYDHSDRKLSRKTIGTGHLGRNIYPGVLDVYNGSMKYMEKH